jgi:hypothetical protein
VKPAVSAIELLIRQHRVALAALRKIKRISRCGRPPSYYTEEGEIAATALKRINARKK